MSRKVKFEFNPFDITGREPKKNKADALEEIKFLVHAEILRYVSQGKSPVAGYGNFPKLNKQYAKSQKGGNTLPNLELTGDMLSALEITSKGNKIVVEVPGKEADKADGHNNHSGDSKLPLRRFIPAEDEFFKRQIENSIKEIIDRHNDEV